MTLIGFLVLLIIAAIAGVIGQAISGYPRGGLIISILIGFCGAFVGTWIAAQFHLPEYMAITIDGETFPLFWAVIGSAVLTAIIGWLSRQRRLI
jgi:uncharacterized membrane protein YeaQ/YmgE (transglycosylase-associated protein family)